MGISRNWEQINGEFFNAATKTLFFLKKMTYVKLYVLFRHMGIVNLKWPNKDLERILLNILTLI